MFDCIGRAAERQPLTGANPLLHRRAAFWLLSFPPDTMRPSLVDLDTEDSSPSTMSTPSLVRTPDQRRRPSSSCPDLKSSASPSLPVARLQECATLPAIHFRISCQFELGSISDSEQLINVTWFMSHQGVGRAEV
jgi:hypothetical protein